MPDTTDEGKIHFLSPQLLKKLDYQTSSSKFFASATYMSRRTEPESLDFSFGDPYEMPPPGFVEALQRWSVPQNSSWYGYKGNIPESRVAVSAALQDKRGLSIFWTLDKQRRKVNWINLFYVFAQFVIIRLLVLDNDNQAYGRGRGERAVEQCSF